MDELASGDKDKKTLGSARSVEVIAYLPAIKFYLLEIRIDVRFPVYNQIGRAVGLTGKRIDDTADVNRVIGIGVGRKDGHFGDKAAPACRNFGDCEGAQGCRRELRRMRSIRGPGGFGYAQLGQQDSCPIFKGLTSIGGLAGQHLLEQLMHYEPTLPTAADCARNFRVVRPRGKLFRESHGIGEDFVTIGRNRGIVRHLVAAWAAPLDGAASGSVCGGFIAPGQFILGIVRLFGIGNVGGIHDRPGIECR
jgi:hypothetical protein